MVDPLVGRTIAGRYRLISRLGVGGMSSVYLARHVMIERLMAIKTLRPELSRDPIQRDRFLREARAVNRINHDNIVEITDFGDTEDGLVYLVMEYVPGESLYRTLTRDLFAPARAINIARQVAHALGRAHQMGVVHRDLKPENILLVDRPGRPDFVKILDFGIAKILDAPSLTGSQQIFGTPGYIAPEYIASSDIDGRADLYSLGVLMYEMITGALPFEYEYPGDLLIKHMTESPIPPVKRRPELDPALNDFIMRCLEKNPDQRFRDAFHFLDALDAAAGDAGEDELFDDLNEFAQSRPAVSMGDGAPTLVPQEPDAVDVRKTQQDPLAPFGLDHVERDPLRDTFNDASGRGMAMPPLSIFEGAGTSKENPAFVIPSAPSVESVLLSIDIDLGSLERGEAKRGSDEIGLPTPFEPEVDGLLGVRRWRRRYDVICALLEDLVPDEARSATLQAKIDEAGRRLIELEHKVARLEFRQAEVEELDQAARRVRADLGRAIDVVSLQLSQARTALDEVQVRSHLRGQEAVGAGESPSWDSGAWEAQVAQREGRVRDLEAEITKRRTVLESKSEQAEDRLHLAMAGLEQDLADGELLAQQLKAPLDEAERLVASYWDAG